MGMPSASGIVVVVSAFFGAAALFERGRHRLRNASPISSDPDTIARFVDVAQNHVSRRVRRDRIAAHGLLLVAEVGVSLLLWREAIGVPSEGYRLVLAGGLLIVGLASIVEIVRITASLGR